MWYIIFWVCVSIVVGYVARSIGRRMSVYFMLSLILSPLIGLLILLIKGKPTEDELLDTNDHIFYCSKCDYAYGGHGSGQNCPGCGAPLSETTVLNRDWDKSSEQERKRLKKQFSAGNYLRGKKQSAAEPRNIPIGDPEVLRKYKELLDMGAITQEEYEAKKKQILNL